MPIRGHAVELRINAEDPVAGFQPSPGRITEYREPGGFGVRVDSAIEAGAVISPYYDNLAAKLIVWADTREHAIAKALRAAADFEIKGIATTLTAHPLLLTNELFQTGRHYTKYVEDVVDFTALGTDGGPRFSTSLSPFSSQGGGVDKVVDNADRMRADYKLISTYFDLKKPFEITETYTNAFLDRKIKMPQ